MRARLERLMRLGIRVGLIVLAIECYLVHLTDDSAWLASRDGGSPSTETILTGTGVLAEATSCAIGPSCVNTVHVWSTKGSVAVVRLEAAGDGPDEPPVEMAEIVNPTAEGEMFTVPNGRNPMKVRAVLTNYAAGEVKARFQ